MKYHCGQETKDSIIQHNFTSIDDEGEPLCERCGRRLSEIPLRERLKWLYAEFEGMSCAIEHEWGAPKQLYRANEAAAERTVMEAIAIISKTEERK